ncbi:triose-phosphate isomerase [Pseudoroseicyclus tamaricis]|uniref:Triosephosphate isomerase n=1 Tax=Pseudoroseicyclus tamaricis TaxID=2705421 RepID=A0A6B2JQJ6_9RHOB|nr:triose-phosphate isomerase [Pseudoroseicyclus tamaricis]NDV00408.1 triose-phosphate isomerase [Pseudoroseicyclus tamaricis]
MPKKLAAGNWKMNGLTAGLDEVRALQAAHPEPSVGILICPPATLLSAVAGALGGTAIAAGGQDCHAEANGAHTGDISASMLADAGASHVIVGHSERRGEHGESDEDVAAKAAAAHGAGLTAIICLGESQAQREAGEHLAVITAQLAGSLPGGATAANTIIAYEPIWAIGTGLTAGPEEIAEAHTALREALEARLQDGAEVTLLYGGSVKGANAAEIFAVPNVDGALVGGASLTSADFSPIISALEET